ncbi:MAG: metallopeptidase TldD-related protein [Acidimicrobiia bacterium]|nr:metallopeptidase TldD-related protein [Acidimicrobiia bacterium]
MSREWGYLAIDDEGQPSRRNVLIEDGVLTDYMWDHLRGRKDGRGSSGNGRRQSYQHLPMVRMTNTYLLAGQDDPDDIIASTGSGVYIAHLGGGQVNTATGDFVFGMTEAYLIEDGKVTEPLREGNLIGNGPEVLAAIDAVGNDFAMGPPGTCGKDGQGVPVGDGVPTLRVASADRRRDGRLMAVDRTRTRRARAPAKRRCWSSADRLVARRSATSRSRWWSPTSARPRCASTRAASNRCPRPSSSGIGVRVVRRRPSRASPGRERSTTTCSHETLAARPRQRHRSAPPTSRRTGRARRRRRWQPSTCGTTLAWRRAPPTRKVELALELERRCWPPTAASSGIESAEYVDIVEPRPPSCPRTGIRGRRAVETGCYRRRPTPWPRRTARPRPGSGSRSVATPPSSTSGRPPTTRRGRATRLLGAPKPAQRARSPSCSTPSSPRSSWGSWPRRSAASRC